MAVLTIVKEANTLAGTPCYWLDSEDGVDLHGNEIDQGDHFTPAFFPTAQEAREWAKKHGHEIDEDLSDE